MANSRKLPGNGLFAQSANLEKLTGVPFKNRYMEDRPVLTSTRLLDSAEWAVIDYLKHQRAIETLGSRGASIHRSMDGIIVTHVDPYMLAICSNDLDPVTGTLAKNLSRAQPLLEDMTGIKFTLKPTSLNADISSCARRMSTWKPVIETISQLRDMRLIDTAPSPLGTVTIVHASPNLLERAGAPQPATSNAGHRVAPPAESLASLFGRWSRKAACPDSQQP